MNEFRKPHDAAYDSIPDSVSVSALKGQNGKQKPERVREWLWADLLDAEIPPVEWIADGLIAQGQFTVVIGPPFIGKSTILRNGIHCISTGNDWLGRTTKQVPCIYFTLEGSIGSLKSHFELMQLPKEAPLLISRPTRKLDEPFSWLESRIRQLKKKTEQETGVVILDTVFRFLPSFGKNKEYTDFSDALLPMNGIAEETGWAVVGVHHSSKARDFSSDNLGSESLGSQAITGAADTIISIGQSEGRRWFYTVPRDGDPTPETEIHFDNDRKWSSAGRTRKDHDAGRLEDSILQYVGSQDGWIRNSDIKSKITGAPQAIIAALARLVEKGRLETQGSGKRHDPKEYREAGR